MDIEKKGNSQENSFIKSLGPTTQSVMIPMMGPDGQSGGSDDENSADSAQGIETYLQPLWQRRWLIVFCIIVAGCLGAFQVNRTTPVYTSTATIKYEPTAAQIVNFGGERSQVYYQRDEIQTAVALIKSPKIANRVIDAIGHQYRNISKEVDETSPLKVLRESIREFALEVRKRIVSYPEPVIDKDILDGQQAALGLLNSVSVIQRPNTKLIDITVRSNDPTRASRIANEFAEQFKENDIDENAERFRYALEYLEKQIQKRNDDLDRLREQIYAFNQKHDIRAIDEAYQIANTTHSELIREIEKELNDKALLEAKVNNIDNETTEELLLLDSARYQRMKEQFDELEMLIAQERSKFEDRHPDVQRLLKQRELILENMKARRDELKEIIKGELILAENKIAALTDRLESHKKSVSKYDPLMEDFSKLRTREQILDANLKKLLQEYEQVEIKDDVDPTNVTIVTRGTIATAPTSPNLTKTMILFTIFGFAVGSVIVFGLTYLDRSVKNPNMIEAKLGLPTLGFVPFLKQRGKKSLFQKKKGRRPVQLLNPDSKENEAEAFRYLRTSVQYSSAEHPPQVILVTSCFPQEGKSTVSSNLSIIYAEQGKKTLLIDCDLKRPSLHKIFDVPKMPGLSDVLTGQTSLDEAIVPTEFKNLEMLPAGLITPSPITLLESHAMKELIERLRDRYSMIILDSAPAHGMADALVLSKRVDGLALVVKQGSTLIEVLKRTVEKLRSLDAPILGIVYNNTVQNRGKGYYGYQYGYGYGHYSYRYEQQPEDDYEEKVLADSKVD